MPDEEIQDSVTSQEPEDEQLSNPEEMYDDEPEPEDEVEPVQVVAEAPEEEEEVETPLPAVAYAPDLPADMYTQEEVEWMEQAVESPDPRIRLQLQQFISNKTNQYYARAMQVTQAQTSKLPPQFMGTYGGYVTEYLNTMVEPNKRSSQGALDEAISYATHRRAVQDGVGHVRAFREAADLLDGGSTRPKEPATKKLMDADKRTPEPSVAAVQVGREKLNGTREDRAEARVLRGLGID